MIVYDALMAGLFFALGLLLYFTVGNSETGGTFAGGCFGLSLGCLLLALVEQGRKALSK